MDDAAVVSGLVAAELGLGFDERHREAALDRESARGGESDDAAAHDEDVCCAGHGAGSSHTRPDDSDRAPERLRNGRFHRRMRGFGV
jgi:hypothetical protein